MYQNYAIPHFSGDAVFERMNDLQREAEVERQAKQASKSAAARKRTVRFEWPAFFRARQARLKPTTDTGC